MSAGRNCVSTWRLAAASLVLCLGADAARADTACLLDTEWSAAVERTRLALESEHTLDVSVFIVGHDPFSLSSMALLRDAARRGVAVRLLLDANWNKLPREIEAHLLASGVEIRHYHPFRLHRPLWLTRRMHDKLVVADRKALIAGGRNVESPYFGLGRQLKRRNYIDADVLVSGEIAAIASEYFDELWNSSAVRPLRRSARNHVTAKKAEETLDKHFAWLENRIEEVRGTPEAEPPSSCREVGPVRFVHDPPGKKGKAPGVAEALIELLDNAKERVVIESPYLVPTKKFRNSLQRALGRGKGSSCGSTSARNRCTPRLRCWMERWRWWDRSTSIQDHSASTLSWLWSSTIRHGLHIWPRQWTNISQTRLKSDRMVGRSAMINVIRTPAAARKSRSRSCDSSLL